MMEPKWTDEQKKAIDTRGCSLLVAAAAGAGKTAVLVERIIRKITVENVDIDHLLVVTFTNAAASEMRERIGDAISKEIEKNPDSPRLQEQIALLARADITTIHSFCLEVIKNNFQLLDIDPSFRIADTTECVLLKQEALEELFDEKYEDENCSDSFLNLVDCYGGGKDDRELQDIVMRLYEFSRSMPWPEEWLNDMAEKFNVDDSFDFGSSPWAEVLMGSMQIEISGALNAAEKLKGMLKGFKGFEGYLGRIDEDINSIRSINASFSSWDDLAKALSCVSFGNLPRCGKGADEEVKKNVQDIRKRFIKDRINIIKDAAASADPDRVKDELKKLYPSMHCLASLAVDFGKKYAAKKKEKNVVDFNDIEHYCIDILAQRKEDGNAAPSPVALKYREKFDEVLIDEYQDSNMVQELILSMVSKKDAPSPNLFMVGDVKQSIYRFRQAKPELFLEKYNTFGDEGRERRILLYKNFRSRKEVIDGVNYIFKSVMSEHIGELEYGDLEKLNPGAQYLEFDDTEGTCGGPVEINIIETKKQDESVEEADDGEEASEKEDNEEDDLSATQLEARMAARRILELVSGQNEKFEVYDKLLNGYRKVDFKDIVILMRSVSIPAPIFMEELSACGIPVYADTGSGYFEVAEVETIMSLLQIIDNPMQDIPLLAVLRSPIASFTPDELISIRMEDGKKGFYEALKLTAGDEGNQVKGKARDFLSCLEKWRDKSQDMSISEFIWYLYNETGYYAYAGAMPGGIQRQANLKVLFERAKEYEETSYKGLFNFINFINKLKGSSGDMGEAKTLGENENVVRIMSIHKSKGLEFPVVFVCCLGRKFNLKDLESPILFHHDLGFGPDFVDSKRRIQYPTIVKEALKSKMKLENYSEEMRILYVALTRAKEKLILTGTVSDFQKSSVKWSESLNCPGNKIPEYQILNGSNFLDWICPALLKHEGCQKIREHAGIAEAEDYSLIHDESMWDIRFYKRDGLAGRESGDSSDAAAAVEFSGDGRYAGEINRRLGYKYPYILSSKLPAKISVTELKRMFGELIDDEYTQNIFVPPLISKPAFLEKASSITPAEKGTIMHLVMQHTSIKKAPSEDDTKSLLNCMAAEEFITDEQKCAVDIKRIVSFFESPLGIRMLKSKSINREVPFYIEIDSREIYSSLPENYSSEKIVLQGVIDCYFEEDDGIVLIDYKTDYVPDGGEKEIQEKYKLQIEYYSKALEKLTGKNIKDKYIYLFYNGEILQY